MNQIVVVGSKQVGKTSLISHYLNRPVEQIPPEDTTTPDWTQNRTMVKCACYKNHQVTHYRLIRFEDTSNNEQEISLLELNMDSADAFLFMVDVTRMEETIEVAQDLLHYLFTYLLPEHEKKPDVMILANKIDLVEDPDDHEEEMESVRELSKKHNIPYMQISVETGENVEVALEQIVNMMEKSTCDDCSDDDD